jgi:hypothetical protein
MQRSKSNHSIIGHDKRADWHLEAYHQEQPQFGLMPAARMTPAHFGSSLLIRAATSSGVAVNGSKPSPTSRASTSGYSALLYAQCHDADEATIRQTEGPYFKPSSPQRADLVEPDTKARLVEINGQVQTRSCRPVERALVDLWHADERGEYDNAGFRFMSW